MELSKRQEQTNKNIQEKANLIWEIATNIYGLYKPHEYGKVILPMTVLKRFDDALKKTKQAVLDKKVEIDKQGIAVESLRNKRLCEASGYQFYNTSKFDFDRLNADPDNIKENFEDYIAGYSDNVKDIINCFKFTDEINKLAENNLLYIIISEFCSEKGDMSPEKITSADMGNIFEELIRKFSESYDEQAGAHFTSRDIIYLMTELLVAPEKEDMKVNPVDKTAYDMAMGTSQMLGCLTELISDINPESTVKCFGQELNPETYAIAKSDMLIKGGNSEGMKLGNTLSEDQFTNYTFDYIISNPPFGIDWKSSKEAVEDEHKLGDLGRFGPGLPNIGDSQMLFLLNGISKLKEDSGRMAIIQNGSSLFNGDAGSGPSEIRRYVINGDLLEAIIQLPTDLFYNTGISTYIWVISKNKAPNRKEKVQLIDASKCFVKRRKNIGNKRVDLSNECIDLIVTAYNDFKDETLNAGDAVVESKVFDNDYFGYTKVTVETALTDEKGNLILKKGQKQPTKGKTDTESIPLDEDIDEYFEREVLPFNPLAYMDRSKDKIGYEIPFTRVFYKYVAPRSSDEIYEEIKKLMSEENELMKELLKDSEDK
ncbi:MAG: type I restriction-modification system subunit M [Prevotella sp.]|nr:type I restriction-modification system subunit M [Prevotella sp.]